MQMLQYVSRRCCRLNDVFALAVGAGEKMLWEPQKDGGRVIRATRARGCVGREEKGVHSILDAVDRQTLDDAPRSARTFFLFCSTQRRHCPTGSANARLSLELH